MKLKTLKICVFSIVIMLFVSGFVREKSILLTSQISFTDSASFEPNTAGGWTSYSYYFNKTTANKIVFEVILKHSNNIDWAKEQWIGTISGTGYIPNSDRKLNYKLLQNNIWKVRIAPDGKCFVNIHQGILPQKESFVIPIKVTY